jgi:uncharacterized protein YodC (DUF2158 family)
MEIDLGDVVQLKSGGPSMTVAEIKDDFAVCRWFDGNRECTNTFPLSSLHKF